MKIAERAAEQLAAIATASTPGPGVSRLPFTPEHRAALTHIQGWMTAAGLQHALDAAGTLVGRLPGPPGAPTLYFGSHQDSVREGGAYDGIMGVLLPLLALESLRERGVALPFAVEVLAFADEEGVRFPTALLGPRALAGTADPAVLKLSDRDGVSLAQAMRDFGLTPEGLEGLRRDPTQSLAYIETHIEQGPVLERADQALGVVTAICGIARFLVHFHGETGHAGTVPMQGRRDALRGAAELIGAVHTLAGERDDLRANVGELSVAPGVVNAIPREAALKIELRAADDHQCDVAAQALHETATAIAARQGLKLDWQQSYRQRATPCDPALRQALREAIGRDAPELPSGATHDASAMADLCPVGMLFVRCRDGLSHHPDEYASPQDMASAVEALERLLLNLASTAEAAT